MQINFLPLDLYTTHLKIINDISFTRREIETIALLVSGRGVKATASALSISPKTVETYIHNIMLKLECNSRESIINFIEKSAKHSVIKRHYFDLLSALSFDKSLSEIAKLNTEKNLSCIMISWKENENLLPLIHQIEIHLKKAGFKVSLEHRENPQSIEELFSEYLPHDAVIYFLPKVVSPPLEQMILCPGNVLFILPESPSKAELSQLIPLDNFIDVSEQENYHFMVFGILQKLFPDINLDSIIRDFTGQCNISQSTIESPPTQAFPKTNDLKEEKSSFNPQSGFKLKEKKWLLISAFLFMGICVLGFLLNNQINPNQNLGTQEGSLSIRSDLVLPMEEAFLNRSELMAQIDQAFKGKEGIQTVALVGIGGSGKTTLARQYAHQQKAPLIWEINAATSTSTVTI